MNPESEASQTLPDVSSPGVVTSLTVAQFMLWTKRYGFQAAVLILLAQSTGLFEQLPNVLGGMC